jgi:hypothetical protein
VWIIYKQVQFVQTRNLGYDRTHVIYFEKEGRVSENLESFIGRAKAIPGIVNVSSAGYDLGSVACTYGVAWEGKTNNDAHCFQQIAVGYDLIETLGIKMKQGRTFSRNYGTDSSALVFNEAAVKVMGLMDPIGKRVRLWDKEMQIIGVTKNFYLESLHHDIKPTVFWLNFKSSWLVMVKLQAGKERQVLSDLQRLYASFNPGFELEYKFLNETYRELYASEQRIASLSKYFAGLAICISCLGLFGLATFTTQRRRKEIGVRKTFGASNLTIVYLLTAEFTEVVLISILIALPLSFWLAKEWLAGFALRTELHIWYFIGAGVIALVVTWLTVGLQAAKASVMTPKDCLRD